MTDTQEILATCIGVIVIGLIPIIWVVVPEIIHWYSLPLSVNF